MRGGHELRRLWSYLNWPNRISLMRLLLVPPFLILMEPSPGARFVPVHCAGDLRRDGHLGFSRRCAGPADARGQPAGGVSGSAGRQGADRVLGRAAVAAGLGGARGGAAGLGRHHDRRQGSVRGRGVRAGVHDYRPHPHPADPRGQAVYDGTVGDGRRHSGDPERNGWFGADAGTWTARVLWCAVAGLCVLATLAYLRMGIASVAEHERGAANNSDASGRK